MKRFALVFLFASAALAATIKLKIGTGKPSLLAPGEFATDTNTMSVYVGNRTSNAVMVANATTGYLILTNSFPGGTNYPVSFDGTNLYWIANTTIGYLRITNSFPAGTNAILESLDGTNLYWIAR